MKIGDKEEGDREREMKKGVKRRQTERRRRKQGRRRREMKKGVKKMETGR